MKIGYARVSTDEQHLDLQLHALQQSGCDQIFSDRGMSGARTDRPGLQQALAAIQPGDTLTVWKLDRLGRSLGHLVTIIGDLDRSGVRVVSLTEAIDTRSSAGRFTFHLIAALAEFERSLISERTRAGLAAARRRGRKPGRPAVLDAQKLEKARALLAYKSEVAVARILNVHQRTLRRKLEVTCDGNEPSTAKQDAPHDPAHLTEHATPLLEYSWCRQEIFEVENTATSGFYRSRAQWRRIKLLSPGKKPRMSVGASMPPSRAIALQYALRWK